MSQIDIDGLVNQIAFGKTTPRSVPALGMHISQEAVYLAETALDGNGKLAVRHLVRAPLSADPGVGADANKNTVTGIAAIDKDFLSGGAKCVEMLRQSLAQGKWGTKNVVVSLSHQVSILRYFVMPAMERSFWKSAVPLQAKKYIPLPFASLSQDFQVFPISPDASGPRLGALFAVTAKNNLARISDFAGKLGLHVLGVETACLSALRFWSQTRPMPGSGIYCRVHFDGGNIRIMLSDKGIPIFFREVFLGAQPSLQDQRRLDLEGCVAFAQKQLGSGNVEEVFVSGGGAPLENWRDALGRELGVKSTVCDEAAPLGLKQGAWEGYAAMGASLRFTAPTAVALDLGKIGKVSEDEIRAARFILTISAIVAIWFSLVGLLHFVSYSLRIRELARYRVDPAVHEALAGKSPDDISQLLSSMQKQLTAAQGLTAPPVSPFAVMRDIGNVIPQNVWVHDVAYNSSPLGAPDSSSGSGPTLDMEGNCQADSTINEQDAAYKFRDNLKSSSVIGKIFKSIQVSIQNSAPGSSDGSQGARTSFSIQAQTRQTQ